MLRRVVLGISLVFVLLLCLPALPPVGRELVFRLPTGWISFLRRTLPEVTLNWAGIGMVVVCSGILLVGLHSLGRWLRSTKQTTTVDAPRTWRWRWTGALFGAFWLLFVLILGASGLSRQLTWVSRFEGQLYLERRSGWAEIKQADGALATALVENPTNVALAHASFRRGEYERLEREPTLWEQHHVLLFTNAVGKLVGYVLIPREPAARERIGFYASGEGVSRENQPMAELPAVIARFETLSREQ